MFLALLAAVAIASVGYVAALRHRGTLVMTVVWSILACIAALFFPVVFSSDAYAYAAYGWMALHGLNPYAHAAVTMRGPLLDAVLWQWGNPPPVCVYGPAFVWFAQAVVASFMGFGPDAPLWAFRTAACAALILCAPLAYAAFPENTRAAAATGIVLNPVAIWCCAEGHNDVYVIALALAGFALIKQSRAFSGAALLALSALLKIPGLIAAAAALVAYARDGRFLRIGAGVVAGGAVCVAVSLPALEQLAAGSSQRGHSYFPQFSLQYVLSLPFGSTAAIVFAAALASACFVTGAIGAWKGNRIGLGMLALGLWIAIPNPYPWYALWILPLAFILNGSARWALIALTLASIVRYLPDSTTDVSQSTAVAIALAPLAAAALGFFAARHLAQYTFAFGPPGKPYAGP